MVIFNTHQKIDALRKIMPGGLIFVLDTTDRSFVYKSMESPNCEQLVFSVDKIYGVDNLTRETDFHSHEDESASIKFQKIGGNTYLGVCAPKEAYSEYQLKSVDDYFRFHSNPSEINQEN
ncbi:hypothetical protein SAMN05421640_2714 [Ekhidna lutea]|uniref:Uncharacterized protein n=1 Tax=Ekhidna lutea TaxID=447679 RepID=A0A239KK85_EKHLU|nr:hypothetical protein [Ekhidna lutea]SNT18400.1 hypothetical protein SAMN05421640_2714 [Ekhidna lutea]